MLKRALIEKLHRQLEELVHKEVQTGTEFWLARDLQKVLGYKRWANFTRVIAKAQTTCELAGYDPRDHFLEVQQLAPPDAQHGRQIDDYAIAAPRTLMSAPHRPACRISTPCLVPWPHT